MTYSTEGVHLIAKLIELTGLATVIIGALFSVSRFIVNLRRKGDAYPMLRKDLGCSILLGLESSDSSECAWRKVAVPNNNSSLQFIDRYIKKMNY